MKKLLILIILFNFIFVNAQNAQEIIIGLKKDLKTNPDDKKLATIYSDLTWYYSNISIDSALHYGQKAIDLAKKTKDSTLIFQAFGDIAGVYLKKGEINESLKFYKLSLDILLVKKNNLPKISKLYACLANVYQSEKKYDLSMRNYILALEYADKSRDENVKHSIKNNMSALLLDLKNYKKALNYSNDAIAFFEASKSYATLCPMYTNNGNIYLSLKDTISALRMYEKAKKICKETGNNLFLSKVLNNIGIIKVAQKKYLESAKIFKEANDSIKNLKSEITYFKMKFNDVDVLNKNQNYIESKKKLLQIKKFFEKQNDIDYCTKTYQNLIPVCAYLNENDSVAFYQTKYLEYNQKINDFEILKSTAELETKYQTAKKEKLILEQAALSKQKNIWLIIISSFAAIGLILYNQQRIKSKQQGVQAMLEKELLQEQSNFKIQEQRLDISRELHDSVGSQLTFIISILDNLKSAPVKLDNIIEKKIDNLSGYANNSISELRDTIWALNTENLTINELETRILNFIKDAGESIESIDFDFKNNIKNNLHLTSKQGINIFRVLQESVNNAVKYASASKIIINLNETENQLTMTIQDNGTGFDFQEKRKKSYGLTNMKNRTEEIKGNFDLSSNNHGTIINIKIPITK